MRWTRVATAALAAVLLVGLAVVLAGGTATDPSAPTGTTARPTSPAVREGTSGLATIDVGELPAEAVDTLAVIEAGGPFPYHQDDGVFQNREGLLPDEPVGYYREYTVDTPGSPDRGARRIVAGSAGERFYTDDHYASFREIVAANP